MANKLLGQNFLKNHSVIDAIVAAIDVRAGDTIFEVGSGRGALTLPLAKVCDERGAKLVAVEKDEKLAEALRIANCGLKEKTLEILSGDILEFLNSKFAIRNSSKIVGNIPYYLTGHLLRVISELKARPERCVFTVQKEVAERMVAGPSDMNRLAASVQFWATPRIALSVSRKDFSPEPKVDSAVVILEKKSEPAFPDSEKYFTAMRAIFAQPRKTILNNISATQEERKKEDIIEELKRIGIDPMKRPQDLSIKQIAAIAESF